MTTIFTAAAVAETLRSDVLRYHRERGEDRVQMRRALEDSTVSLEYRDDNIVNRLIYTEARWEAFATIVKTAMGDTGHPAKVSPDLTGVSDEDVIKAAREARDDLTQALLVVEPDKTGLEAVWQRAHRMAASVFLDITGTVKLYDEREARWAALSPTEKEANPQ